MSLTSVVPAEVLGSASRGQKPVRQPNRQRRNSYLCPQTLFKFYPEFDAILGGILNADPQAEIVLLEGQVEHWTNQLKQRFERTLPGGTSRVRFIPARPRGDFLNLLLHPT